MAKLGEICKINMGQSPDSSTYNNNKEGIPFFQGNADFGKINPTIRLWCSNPVKIAKENDILISVRAPIGALNISDCECCIGRGLASLTITTDKCIQKFLWYSLINRTHELISKGTGSTFKAINKQILFDLKIPLPPLEEQEKIAMVLDKVSELIEKREQQLAKLDELIKSRFVEMFGDPVTNSNDWNKEQLKNITKKIGSGSTPKGGKGSYYTEGISLIRSLNVHNGKFEYKDLAYIDELQAKQLNNVMVEEQDVLFNITGASVARSCIVPKNLLPARVNQHVTIIRCNLEQLNPIFLNQQLLNASYQNFLIFLGESNGATRQALTKEQIENFFVIVPPLELQNQFAEFVEQTEKIKVAINSSLDKLKILKKALMQRFFG
ncbi:restriction endonuclease subunit S [Taurinivorans muris]|uniref:Restriction endonuclease subunit S n=1 Tax=Taurinivorans muris TaxID=2787751 RepID=A0ABY5Y1G4_9BACT|nr:restriction endonuclease subunit S [Desulfovibrionaceae bacterium LT0009]